MRKLLLMLPLLALVLASPAPADLRTKTIRLVPDQDWTPTAQAIRITGEVFATDPHAEELKESMDEWLRTGFERLGYEISSDAPLELHYTIDYVDWGSRVRRLAFGFNNSGMGGAVILRLNGEQVGKFKFSSKLRGGLGGGSTNAMGKEVGPPLALKLHNGERDEELHDRKLDN